MPGTKAGGMKAAAANKARYGEDFYKRIGARGGSMSTRGGFASLEVDENGLTGPERARIYGKIGGLKKKTKRKSRKSWEANSASSNSTTNTIKRCHRCSKTYEADREGIAVGFCQTCAPDLKDDQANKAARDLIEESRERDQPPSHVELEEVAMNDKEALARLDVIKNMASDEAVRQLTQVVIGHISSHAKQENKPGFSAKPDEEAKV